MGEYDGVNGNYEMNLLLNDAQKKLSSIIGEIKRQGEKKGDTLFDGAMDLDKMLDFAIENTECKKDNIEYECKEVEGMTVGQVVQQMSDGVVFYRYDNEVLINTSVTGMHKKPNCIEMDLASLRTELKCGNIYTRTKKPWWEGCEGMPVMVRDRDNQSWRANIFDKFDKKNSSHPFICIDICPYKYMRPLTLAERAVIKVRN